MYFPILLSKFNQIPLCTPIRKTKSRFFLYVAHYDFLDVVQYVRYDEF